MEVILREHLHTDSIKQFLQLNTQSSWCEGRKCIINWMFSLRGQFREAHSKDLKWGAIDWLLCSFLGKKLAEFRWDLLCKHLMMIQVLYRWLGSRDTHIQLCSVSSCGFSVSLSPMTYTFIKVNFHTIMPFQTQMPAFLITWDHEKYNSCNA